MADFIIELHLRWYGLRQEAELALYILLVATKHHYKKSTAVHTFARLMDLLNEVSVAVLLCYLLLLAQQFLSVEFDSDSST
jgi:hypothetical protein